MRFGLLTYQPQKKVCPLAATRNREIKHEESPSHNLEFHWHYFLTNKTDKQSTIVHFPVENHMDCNSNISIKLAIQYKEPQFAQNGEL